MVCDAPGSSVPLLESSVIQLELESGAACQVSAWPLLLEITNCCCCDVASTFIVPKSRLVGVTVGGDVVGGTPGWGLPGAGLPAKIPGLSTGIATSATTIKRQTTKIARRFEPRRGGGGCTITG